LELKIERLDQGEKIAAGSALALLACMFLSWFNFGFEATNAWESLHYISPLLAITIAATLSFAFAEASGRSVGDVPVGLVVFVLGCLSALLVLYRLIEPISTPGFEGGSTSATVEAGAFLGFFAAVGIAAGGYVATGGKAVDRLKELLPSSGGAGPADAFSGPRATPPAAPPPPPGPVPVASPPPPPPQSPPEPEPEPEPEPVVMTEEQSVFCEGCGAPLRPTDRFCGKCGQAQSAASEA
jgi:hypothetical protein